MPRLILHLFTFGSVLKPLMDGDAEADGEVMRRFTFRVDDIKRVSRNDVVAGENRVVVKLDEP